MGMDAFMYFVAPVAIPDDLLPKISWGLGMAVGHDRLPAKQVLISKTDTPATYEVDLGCCRHYSEGYARGPLWTFVAVAEWLEANVPGCTVYYGGDAYEFQDATVFDVRRRSELIDYWKRDRGSYHYAPHAACPACPVDGVTMGACGWGPEFRSYRCPGCLTEIELRGDAAREAIEKERAAGREGP